MKKVEAAKRMDELTKLTEEFGVEKKTMFSEKKLFESFIENQINPYLDMKKSASIRGALVNEKYLAIPTVRQMKRNKAREKVLNS